MVWGPDRDLGLEETERDPSQNCSTGEGILGDGDKKAVPTTLGEIHRWLIAREVGG